MYISDIKFNVDIIDECIEEMSTPIQNREMFLTSCICERLDKCNKLYLDEFNIELTEVEDIINNPNVDIPSLSYVVKRLSKLSSSVSLVALELLDII